MEVLCYTKHLRSLYGVANPRCSGALVLVCHSKLTLFIWVATPYKLAIEFSIQTSIVCHSIRTSTGMHYISCTPCNAQCDDVTCTTSISIPVSWYMLCPHRSYDYAYDVILVHFSEPVRNAINIIGTPVVLLPILVLCL